MQPATVPGEVPAGGYYPSNIIASDPASRIPQHYYVGPDGSHNYTPANPSATMMGEPYQVPPPTLPIIEPSYGTVIDPFAHPGTDPMYGYSPQVVVPAAPAPTFVQPVYQQPVPTTTIVQPVYQQPATTIVPATTTTTTVPVLPPLERVQLGTRQGTTTLPATTVTYTGTGDASVANVLNTHRNDADLSRLEVFHFAPKQNTQIPIALITAPAAPSTPPYYPYTYPWHDLHPYGYSSYGYPPYDHYNYNYNYDYPYGYYPPQSPFLPPIPKRTISSQTDKPEMKTRALSPMESHSKPLDRTVFPLVHQRLMLDKDKNDPYYKAHPDYHRSVYSSPLPDCRCIHCQRERAKILNYYPD